jgi:hypothetical protein
MQRLVINMGTNIIIGYYGNPTCAKVVGPS